MRLGADARRARALIRCAEGYVCRAIGSGTTTAFSDWMKFKLVTAFILSSATAIAGPHDEITTAREQVHTASTRVSLLEIEMTIAERDIATARIVQDTATKQRSRALFERDNKTASAWSQRHAEAVKDEREAQNRAAQKRIARDRAFDELQASTARATKLERSARASR